MKEMTPILLIGWLALLAGAAAGVEPLGEPLRSKPWKLVFCDEFDGRELDESKWTRRGHGRAFVWDGATGRLSEDHADVDGQGHFVVKVSRDADGTYVYHHGVETKGKFQRTYGYFETRARFTRQPGWWGAVWLFGVEVGPNPFVMGQEIDVFEDFVKPKKKLDFAHNVHLDSQLPFAPGENRRLGKLDGNTLYRVSRGTTVVVVDWDAFHVVGVEWTPLEYVFYCDGKETFRLDYQEKPDRILLEADGEPLAEFTFSPQLTTGKSYWGNYQALPSQTVRLAEGTHVLCVRFDATPFNFGGLEFTPAGAASPGK